MVYQFLPVKFPQSVNVEPFAKYFLAEDLS